MSNRSPNHLLGLRRYLAGARPKPGIGPTKGDKFQPKSSKDLKCQPNPRGRSCHAKF